MSLTFEISRKKIIRFFATFFTIIFFSGSLFAQHQDSALDRLNDTSKLRKDSSVLILNQPKIRSYHLVMDSVLSASKWIDVKDTPVYFMADKRQEMGKEFAFYSICILVFLLGIFNTFYHEYLIKLFRVFFNTSLRQSQLSEQLGQAAFPSLVLNFFFVISTGVYLWALIKNYGPTKLPTANTLLPLCIVGVATIYIIKFFIIKFIGWITGLKKVTDQYIFIIFLVNKIAGVVLLPFIILMEFAKTSWIHPLEIFSLLLLGLFFIIRYFKTYNILENQFSLNPFHFLIYIISIEIIPLVIIYRLVIDYFI
jgi:Domain of unknown function (DUF4271)